MYKNKLFLNKDDDATGARIPSSISDNYPPIVWRDENLSQPSTLFDKLIQWRYFISDHWTLHDWDVMKMFVFFLQEKKDVSQCFEAESIIAEISLTWFIVSENWTKFGPLPVDNQFGELM